MNKNIAIICILLITISICGCNEPQQKKEKPIENDIIPLKELSNNLTKYIDKNITVQGYIKNAHGTDVIQTYTTSLCSDNQTNPAYCIILYIPANIVIYPGLYEIYGTTGIYNTDNDANIKLPRIDVLQAKQII